MMTVTLMESWYCQKILLLLDLPVSSIHCFILCPLGTFRISPIPLLHDSPLNNWRHLSYIPPGYVPSVLPAISNRTWFPVSASTWVTFSACAGNETFCMSCHPCSLRLVRNCLQCLFVPKFAVLRNLEDGSYSLQAQGSEFPSQHPCKNQTWWFMNQALGQRKFVNPVAN